MWHVAIRRQAIQLQEALERVAAGPLSPRQRAFVAACREDLAVILAATDVDTAALLEGAGVESFAALRGLLQRQ